MRLGLRLGAAFVISAALCASAGADAPGVELLLSKARSLEARGRMDLAAQSWRQALLVDPSQTEALAGLARFAKENGDAQEERKYLDRLRRINPKDPAIAAIEKMHMITPQERNRLEEAGRFAMQHKPDEAMKIYHEVFGADPPTGRWAEAFYETEAASTGGRDKAITQLRQLCAGDSGNEVYRLWLARVLTYDQKTRMEGFQLLETIRDPGSAEQARAAWRRALLWEKDNPAAQRSLESYMQRYPDPELQQTLNGLREKRDHAQLTADEQHAFQALGKKDMATAETTFQDVLRRSPNDANAIAGLAFVRLNQKKFNEAIGLFERAKALAPQRSDLRDGYETAKFWSAMQRGSDLQEQQPDVAIAAYEDALAIQPQNDQPVLGIARIRMRQRDLAQAEAGFQQVMQRSPDNAEAVAGLGFVRLDQKNFDEAARLLENARTLSPNDAGVDDGYRTAKFWALMTQAAAALEQKRADAAVSGYQEALTFKPDAKEALAGLAEASRQTKNTAQAIKAYQRLLEVDPTQTKAWFDLMKAQLGASDPKSALETARQIPASARSELESRSDYLAAVSLALFRTNQAREGSEVLHRALEAANRADSQEALYARLEIANLLMTQGQSDQAVAIYKQSTALHPDDPIAWQGLIGAFTRAQDFKSARAALASMPRSSYDAAAKNAGFLAAIAAIYSSGGECSQAESLLGRSLELDKAAGRPPASGTQLQLADIWMRERQYARARQQFRQVLDKDPGQAAAWRGYVNALHEEHNDQGVVSETDRMPAQVRTELEADPHFLSTLASAHAAFQHHEQVVRLLQMARTRYEAEAQQAPAGLEVQLAWAMVSATQGEDDIRGQLERLAARSDLSTKQQEAVKEIWSTWSVRRADAALQRKDPAQAVAVLTDAIERAPDDQRLRSTLASVYVQQRDYQNALSVYQSWGMSGAQAGDYRAAAGAALALHNDVLSDRFLKEGLQHFPADAELLHMTARDAISRGQYNAAEHYLNKALAAATNASAAAPSEPDGNSDKSEAPADTSTDAPAPAPNAAPACRASTADRGHAARDSAKPIFRHVAFFEAQTPTVVSDDPKPSQNKVQPQTIENVQQQPQDQSQLQPPDTSTEQQIRDELDLVKSRNTPFLTLGSPVRVRNGDEGIDRLVIQDGDAIGSVTASNSVRFTIDARITNAHSGTPDGLSQKRFGTLPEGARFSDQSQSGFGGEAQLSTDIIGLMVGLTPRGFLVENVTGGIRLGRADGPITLLAVREPMKDSLLSYAGARDPATGQVWGGVISNTAALQLAHDVSGIGQYLSARYGFLRGQNVEDNWSVDGNAGAYWRVLHSGQGGLSLGLNVTGMHYDKNLSFFTLGQGGYFSPQFYGLASAPVTWYDRNEHVEYEIAVAIGVQHIVEDPSPFFPMMLSQPIYQGQTRTDANYNLSFRLEGRLASHVMLGVFANANNARDYSAQVFGVTVKILADRVPANTGLHIRSVPDWRGRQPFTIY